MKKSILKITVTFVMATFGLTTNAQVSVKLNGHTGIGNFAPLVRLQVTGDFALFTQTGGVPNSAPFIRCHDNFSGPTTPDYTWWNNDQAGFFHPFHNAVGVTLGAQVAIWNTGFFKYTVSGNALA